MYGKGGSCMRFFNRRQTRNRKIPLKLVLGGGGIKGIAYLGVMQAAGKRGYDWKSIAGVSAGSIAGSYIAAGYRAEELFKIIDEFDLSNVDINKIPNKVPIVQRMIELRDRYGIFDEMTFRNLLTQKSDIDMESADYRAGLLKNIVTYSQYGSLFDGDYIEEWVWKTLYKKGVRTFGDLKNGIVDPKNPRGYKIRMTAVDCNRAKVITLPDDLSYYDIDPDKFEVAKAVRMSSCVPFAFKPVKLTKQDGNKTKIHYIVDGGVLDRFPSWLVEDSKQYPVLGFTLDGGEKKGVFHLDTPLGILKALISAVHDIGVPKDCVGKLKYLGEISTTKVKYLDFNVSEEDKKYLYESGKKTAEMLFNQLELDYNYNRYKRRRSVPLFFPFR